jgi:hypothetical protein
VELLALEGGVEFFFAQRAIGIGVGLGEVLGHGGMCLRFLLAYLTVVIGIERIEYRRR